MALPTRAGRPPRAWHIIGLAASVLIFSLPAFWTRYRPDPPYALLSIAAAALMALIVARWPGPAERPSPAGFGLTGTLIGVAGLGLAGVGLHRWIDVMLWQPLDPSRGDMLAVVQGAVRTVLAGGDPYRIYHVPWDAPLPYGPVLWAPFLLPYVFQTDLRVITVAGEVFVPLLCAGAAALEGARGRLFAVAAWLMVLGVLVSSPDLATFTTVGHTPSYWPLIPLFALFVVGARWNAAAIVLGLLVAGRTTMVAVVPMFYIAVWWRSRAALRSAALSFAVTLALVLAPFAIWNPAAMWDGMVASYPRVMKGVVWTSSDGGVVRTIGLTGWLLAHHLEAFVELTQVAALMAIYAIGWRAIRRGAAPLPWMALALLVFSMTTLWPVYYVYFDVLLMFVSCALAETLPLARGGARVLKWWLAAVVVTAAAVFQALMIQAPRRPVLDLASGVQRGLAKGFVRGTGELSGSAAIWGTGATLALPRGSTADADIVINGAPVVPSASAPQAVTATLNGVLLGTVFVERGWRDMRFQAPSRAWRVGSNALELQCASSSPPIEVGLGDEARHISLALRRVEVVPR